MTAVPETDGAVAEVVEGQPTIPLRALGEKAVGNQPASGPAARLIVLTTDLAGMEIALNKASLVIGRTEENDVLLNHRSISRHHAKIVRDGEHYTIVDLQSANGIRVNGEDYERIELNAGDVIELGHVKIRFVGPLEDFVFDPHAPQPRRLPIKALALGGGALAIIGLAALFLHRTSWERAAGCGGTTAASGSRAHAASGSRAAAASRSGPTASAGDAGHDPRGSQAGDGGGGLGDRPGRSRANCERRRCGHPPRGDRAWPARRNRAPGGLDVCQVRRGRERQELRGGGQRLPADPGRQRLQAARPAAVRRGAHAPGGRAHDGGRKGSRRGALRRGPPGGDGGHPARAAQPADPGSLPPLSGATRAGRGVVSGSANAAGRRGAGRGALGVTRPAERACPVRAFARRDGGRPSPRTPRRS